METLITALTTALSGILWIGIVALVIQILLVVGSSIRHEPPKPVAVALAIPISMLLGFYAYRAAGPPSSSPVASHRLHFTAGYPVPSHLGQSISSAEPGSNPEP